MQWLPYPLCFIKIIHSSNIFEFFVHLYKSRVECYGKIKQLLSICEFLPLLFILGIFSLEFLQQLDSWI